MASSVASAREMERWARERREAGQRTVPVPQAAKRDFNALQPDFDQLANFEKKVHQLAERQEAKESELEVAPIINVMGSTAGAGSGEFHTYRGYRAKEMARLKKFEDDARNEEECRQWEEQRDAAAAVVEAAHAKNAAKRNKKKEKRKAAQEAEKAEKAERRQKAARTDDDGAGIAAAAAAAAGGGDGAAAEPAAGDGA